jgi:hypothetical protein
MRKNIALFILFLFAIGANFGQENIKVGGTVLDKKTNLPISFVGVIIPQMGELIYTNDSGQFSMEINPKTDSLVFSYIGYKTEVLRKRKFHPDSMLIYLSPDEQRLDEIVIKAPRREKGRDTLAMRIFREVMEHKDANKPKAYNTYSYEEYVKTVASLYNIKPSIVNRKILKSFKFIFENQDSTTDGTRFVPLILKETITDHYYEKESKKEKQIVKASKVSGIEQLRFSELLDIAFDEMDVYGNALLLYNKSFQLPFADGALLNYKYFILDSIKSADSTNWIYNMAFFPKAKGDLAFSGTAQIVQPDYAIKNIELGIDKRANINFISNFYLNQEFELIENKGWFRKTETRHVNMPFLKRKKSKSVQLKRSTSRNNIQLDIPISDTIYNGEKVSFIKDYTRRKDNFWDSSRQLLLSKQESNVYWMLDSLKKTKVYKVASTLGRLFASGYYRAGPVDFGNLVQMVSFNDVEGVRLRLNVKTNQKLSEWFNIFAYGAYGTEDKQFKYGLEFNSRLPSKPGKNHSIGANWYDDYQRFSLAGSDLNYDYIYYSLLRKDGINDLVSIKDLKIFYNRTWFQGFSSSFSGQWRRFQTIPGKVEFPKTQPDGTITKLDNFTVFTPRINISATPGAKFFQYGKKPVFLKGNLPRIYLTYEFSKKGWLKSQFSYHKFDLKIEQRINTPFGYTRYILNGTKILGNAPYPLLSVHPGNESFLMAKDRFTQMDEARYLADQKIEFFIEHHFEGFFLNKIPLIKKLQLREKFITKLALSNLDPKKVDFIDIPQGLTGLNGFYAEMGFGIENIGKLLAIDFMWRLTQKNQPGTDRFGITFWVSPNF